MCQHTKLAASKHGLVGNTCIEWGVNALAGPVVACSASNPRQFRIAWHGSGQPLATRIGLLGRSAHDQTVK